ncbi:MAG: phosphoglycerate mutase family protein [Proteobacteria bacterium]|nr:phosphoglycerate mutase family protein [Pseudomonadota bacterium]
MTIYIVRHGQTIWNLESRKQGHSDSPLTLKGIEQAKNICKILQREKLNYHECEIFVSPLFRAKQYAQIILESLKIEKTPIIEHLIKEHGFGSWEGLTQEEVDKMFAGETEKRMRNRWNYIIPGGGESYEIISKRAEQFLENHYKDKNKNLILVCHEMISKVLRGILLNLSKEEILDLGHPQDTVYKYYRNNIDDLR